MTIRESEASTEAVASHLIGWFEPGTQYIVALSGGVDSAVVAKAAVLSEANATVVTARSVAVSQRDQEDAARVAQQLGAELVVIDTNELARAQYVANGPDRCFHCKSHLFESLHRQFPHSQIVTGTNQDDLGDYRPGLRAADQASVKAPLAELGIGKQVVRQLAEYWQLAVASKPASPCLASRLAYGVEVTAERLERIDLSEVYLRSFGLREFRVRLHEGEMARIEVHANDMQRVLAGQAEIVAKLKALGFRFVTLDLAGFASGSLNQVLPLETLRGSVASEGVRLEASADLSQRK